MSLNRREMLRLGAVGVGGAMLSSAASSVGLPSIVFQTPPVPVVPQPQFPAQFQAPAAIDPMLFQRAKAALAQHPVAARDVIGIVDFSKPSSELRFHVVDLASGALNSNWDTRRPTFCLFAVSRWVGAAGRATNRFWLSAINLGSGTPFAS